MHLCAAGVFLLRKTKEVGRKSDLRLDLFFAVTKIVVRNHRDHTALFIAASELEGAAIIVELIRILPAHAVTHLSFGGLTEMRQAEILFLQLDQMRGQEDASGMAGPMSDIQSGIIGRISRIAAVTEHAFHKIQICRHGSRRKETYLKRFFLHKPRHLRAYHRP